MTQGVHLLALLSEQFSRVLALLLTLAQERISYPIMLSWGRNSNPVVRAFAVVAPENNALLTPPTDDRASEEFYALCKDQSVPRQLLSTQQFNEALLRLEHLDVPVSVFIDGLKRNSPWPLPNFEEVLNAGLQTTILSELHRRDDDAPPTISPLAFLHLHVNSGEVLHS